MAGLAAYGHRNGEGLAALAQQWGEGDRRLLLALPQKGIDLGSHGLQLAAVATWKGHRWGELQLRSHRTTGVVGEPFSPR